MTPEFSSTLLDALPTGTILSETDTGSVIWVNDAACELLSAGRDTLVGASVEALLGTPREAPGRADADRHVIRASTGARRWLQCQRVAVGGPDGVSLTLRTLIDITEFQARAKGRAAVMVGLDVSQIDSESGALTRRAVLTELGAEVSRSRRYGNPLSAVLVRFSDCDRLGESVVETVENRRLVAHAVNELLRWVDTVGVLEPGKFLIVLPETGIEPATQVRTRIATALAALGQTQPAIRSVVTCTAWSEGDSPERMLDRLGAEADRQVAESTFEPEPTA